MNIKLVAGRLDRETVIAAATKLAEEDHHVEVIYPEKILGLPEGVFAYQDLTMLSNVDDSFFVALSPEAMPALRRYYNKPLKKALGVEGLAQVFTENVSMALSFLSNAGALVVTDFDEAEAEPVKVCYWVSGNYVWPIAFAYDTMPLICPQGGPFQFSGLSVIPVWNRRLATVGEAVRLACSTANYSGPVFLELCNVPDSKELAVQFISFRYPEEFIPAFLELFEEKQTFGDWLQKLWKGTYNKKPRIRRGGAVCISCLNSLNWADPVTWRVYPTEHISSGYTAMWAYDMQVNTSAGETFPEIVVNLDGQPQLEYTYKRLESRRISVYSDVEPPSDEEAEEPQTQSEEEIQPNE